MTCTIGNEHGHYGDAVRHLRLGETIAPTHTIHRSVAAFPILATDHLADGYVSVLVKGEIMLVDVPRGFAWHSTPVRHDMLIIGLDSEITHCARALFDAEAEAIRSNGAQMRPGQQLASIHDIRPSGTARVLNADGAVMVIPVPPEGLPLVPRYPAAALGA